MNKSNILSHKLNLVFLTQYGALACFFPFLTYYFQQRGLSYTEIGIAYAVNSIASIVTQPIWGVITDKYSNKKSSIIITMVLSSIMILNFIFANNFYYIVLSLFLLLSFQSSVNPLSDAYCYEIIEHNKHIQYGKIRLMGSIGYAVAALLLGQAVKYLGINSAFIFYSILMALAAVMVLSINFKGKSSRQKIDTHDFVNLIKDYRFAIFVISVAILNIATGSNGSYISVLIEKTGGDVSKLGIVWFVIAISELPAFFFGNKLLRKFGDLNLYMIAIVLFTVRFFLSAICTSYVIVIIIQLMQGITFPLLLVAAYQYLDNITPSKMKTSSMTFYAAACGIGGLLGNIGGGVLLERIDVFLLYKIMSLICIIGLAVAVILKQPARAQK